MKKFLPFSLILILTIVFLAGCGGSKKDDSQSGDVATEVQVDKLLAPPTAEDLYEENSVLKMTAGTAKVKHADGKEEEVSAEIVVIPGDTITILDKGAGTLVWFDDSISRLKAGTVMTIDKADFNPDQITQTHINFHVVKGEIWNKVRGLVDQDSDFLSYSGAVVSGVRGSVYNLVVDDSSVTIESVAHSAFLAPVDPKTNAIGKEKRIVRGQLATAEGKKAIQLAPIAPKRLKEEWFAQNGDEDRVAAKAFREKNLDRLVQRVGALPGEDGYGEKLAQIQDRLSEVTDPEKMAELKARIAQLQARESIVLALKDPDRASAEEAATRLGAIRSSVDAEGLSDQVKEKIRAEIQIELQGLDRTMEDILPDTKGLYEIKQALRQQEVDLAPDAETMKAIKERMAERRYFELNDVAELPNFTMPADLRLELQNAQMELQRLSDFWQRNAAFQQDYIKMIQEFQANPTDPAAIQKLQNYFQDPATQQKLQEAQRVMEQALPTLQKLQEAATVKIPLDANTVNLLNVPAEDPAVVRQLAPYYGGPSGQ